MKRMNQEDDRGARKHDSEEWRDGFPFLANQLSLDFLNTQPVVEGAPVELLPDADALLRWLTAARLLTANGAERAAKEWRAQPGIEAEVAGLRDFREELRRAVVTLEAGKPVPASFLNELNSLLERHPAVTRVAASATGLVRLPRFEPHRPSDALAALADEAANLLASTDHSRVRQCAGCVLHFYDVSKKGTRRWCSMKICGNRAKVAAYAQRHRA